MLILRLPRRARSGLLAAAVVAFLSGCNGAVSTPTDSPASSIPGKPTQSSAPELAIRGNLDIQSLPADAIPWDEVGLGWFLLAYDPEWNGYEDVPGDEEGATRDNPTEEEVYLVSPDATVYFVRSLAGLGKGRVAMWLGSVIGLHERVWSGGEDPGGGPVTSINLETGASRLLVDSWSANEDVVGVLPSGELVTQVHDDNWSPAYLRARDLSGAQELCSFGGRAGSSVISPDGSRAICTEPRSDGQSDVLLYDFATATSTMIDVFKYEPDAYGSIGWVDASSVVIYRWDDESNDWRYWTYNVDTQKLSDYTYDELRPPIWGFGANAHRIVVNGESFQDADSITVQTIDGAMSATISPCHSYMGVWFSEASAIVACYDSTGDGSTLYHANLATGNVTILASPYETQDMTIQVFPGLAP